MSIKMSTIIEGDRGVCLLVNIKVPNIFNHVIARKYTGVVVYIKCRPTETIRLNS